MIELNLEQFICKTCKKKFYINKDDYISTITICPYCKSSDIQNIRTFLINIKEIKDKE